MREILRLIGAVGSLLFLVWAFVGPMWFYRMGREDGRTRGYDNGYVEGLADEMREVREKMDAQDLTDTIPGLRENVESPESTH